MPTVVHVSPHPDDESLGAPCTLLALRDLGWHVVNVAAGLGRPADHGRRRAELAAALRVAGFTHEESPSLPGLSRGDDLAHARRVLTRELAGIVERHDAELVIGPHPRDGHHGHETVARAIRQLVWTSRRPLTWWMWPLWADLPRPTLMVPCGEDHLRTSARMLDRHAGENDRNDYRALQTSIRTANAVRGVETVFGFGSARGGAASTTSAELLTEVTAHRHRWFVGRPRTFDQPGEWAPLDDLSILSSTRLRPLYRAWLLDASARLRPRGRSAAW